MTAPGTCVVLRGGSVQAVPPGIGAYTGAAIASIAFDEPIAAVVRLTCGACSQLLERRVNLMSHGSRSTKKVCNA